MTTLVLAQRKLKSLIPSINFDFAEEWLESVNNKGIFTYAVLGSIFISVAVYLAALYFTFGIGLQSKNDSQKLEKINKEVSSLQLRVETAELALVKDKSVFLQSMEEISSIRYITPDNTAVSFNQN